LYEEIKLAAVRILQQKITAAYIVAGISQKEREFLIRCLVTGIIINGSSDLRAMIS
jgi:hypothetical protein